MSRVLYATPHGIGDLILASPAIKKYCESNACQIDVAMLKRFRHSGILDHCPYIGRIHYISDPWNDWLHRPAWNESREECEKLAESLGMELIYAQNKAGVPKVLDYARIMGVELVENEVKTEVYTSQEDIDRAEELHEKFCGGKPFVFFQPKSGVSGHTDRTWDNFLLQDGLDWAQKNLGILNYIAISNDPEGPEEGYTYSCRDHAITVDFELMRRASGVVLTNSSLFQACAAMLKKVDLAIYTEKSFLNVCPLHEFDHNVFLQKPYELFPGKVNNA